MSTLLTRSMPADTPKMSTRQTTATTTVCHMGLPKLEAAAWKKGAGSALISWPEMKPARLLSTQPRITA